MLITFESRELLSSSLLFDGVLCCLLIFQKQKSFSLEGKVMHQSYCSLPHDVTTSPLYRHSTKDNNKWAVEDTGLVEFDYFTSSSQENKWSWWMTTSTLFKGSCKTTRMKKREFWREERRESIKWKSSLWLGLALTWELWVTGWRRKESNSK